MLMSHHHASCHLALHSTHYLRLYASLQKRYVITDSIDSIQRLYAVRYVTIYFFLQKLYAVTF